MGMDDAQSSSLSYKNLAPRLYDVTFMSADPLVASAVPVSSWHDCHSSEHFVQFYEDDAVLVDAVVEYIADGLQEGAATVVVASAEHLQIFERKWSALGLDMTAARDSGRYVPLDARATLDKFMQDGWPQREAFFNVIGPVIADATKRGRRVVAFGEMVALLWQEQQYGAAVELEALWNELAEKRHFKLFCAYPLDDDRHAPIEALQGVCKAHSTAIPAESYSGLVQPQDRLAAICELQNKALLLERELAASKRTEELRSLAAAIVESSDDAIISKTLDGIITSWNRGAERLFGYSSDEMIGRPITTLIPGESVHEEQEILARLSRGHRIDHFETERVAKDGRRLDVSISISPVRDAHGTIVGASKVARDISERKRAERALREQERLLQAETAALAKLNELSTRLWRAKSLSEGLGEMLRAIIELVSADKGNIQLLDPACGMLRIEAQSGFDQDFLERYREVSSADDSACARALRLGERVIVEDVEADARCEQMRTVARAANFRAVISIPLFGADGHALGIASTHFRCPHRPGEQQLRRLDLYLRQASDFIQRCRMEDALRSNARAMQEADRRKDEFLALLAHELRNPLAPIRYALATGKKSGRSPEQARRADEIIDRQVSHMSRLLDDLLDVSRITRGTLELKKCRTELTAVIATAIESARPILDKKKHTLSVELPNEPIRLDADPVRLAQVFSNLLINAAKYTDPGGQIVLTAARDRDEIAVRVRDNGIGMSPQMLPRLFTMFSQAEAALTRSEGGLGIGLALAHGLIELHEGVISAHSAGSGQGSEFVVRLPLTAVVDGSEAQDSAQISESAPSRRILVVDDNRDSATTCGAFLESCGHDVQVTFSGRSALAIAEDFRPHVVILDIGMPELDGYEVARRLRARPWADSCQLIAVTGWGQGKDKELASAAGFDLHLTKPVDPAALEPLLARMASA
jgi:PAS domain S-box-containing protein